LSLAVASLLDVGVDHATDIIGGLRTWRATGRRNRQDLIDA
jgi:hypothetical protein